MFTYLINRLPSESLALKSLKDLFLGHYLHVHVGPELSLHVFGCVADIHQSQPGISKPGILHFLATQT